MASVTASAARVTAVVPTYNAAAFVADAIASVRAQTRPVDELLVVDDASQDDSAAIAASLGARVLRLETNRGPSHARNQAIARATGDVVAFLDADDAWSVDHCARLVGSLERHPSAVLAASRVAFFGGSIDEQPVAAVPALVPFDASLALLKRNFVVQTTVVARVDALRAAGGYDESMRFAEDYDLWMRLSEVGPLVYVPEVTARYRSHEAQATRSQEVLIRSAWNARERHGARLVELGQASAADVDRVLRDALDADFREIWHSEHRLAFAALSDVVATRPWASHLHRRWTLRERLGWNVWHSLRRARRLLRRAER